MSGRGLVPLALVAAVGLLAFSGSKAKAADPAPPPPPPPVKPPVATPPFTMPPVMVVAEPPKPKLAAPSTFTDVNGVMWRILQIDPTRWTGDAPPAALPPAYGAYFFSGPTRDSVIEQIRDRANAAIAYYSDEDA
jgi:hypothetical protein